MRTCPECGAPALVHATRDVPYVYKGESTVIPAVEGDFCEACGEIVLGREAGDRYGAAIRAFQQRVNGDVVDAAYIVQVRKKLHLNQQQAGEIFGGGVNAFSRYENGKSQPPRSLVKLLQLLDHHPELLAEVANDAPLTAYQAGDVQTAPALQTGEASNAQPAMAGASRSIMA